MNPIVRKISIVAALVLLFGAAFFTQVLMKKKSPPKRKSAEKTLLREVAVQTVSNGTVATALTIQGSLAAYEKIDLFTEVTGVLTATSKPFKVGSYFKKGEVLLNINDDENRLSLLSQKSSLLNAIAQLMPDLKIDYLESFPQWKNYLDAFDLEKAIAPLPKALNEKEKFFIATKNLHTQYYNIKSAENRLAKYIIRAPFSGVLTVANTNPGSLVRAGQSVGTLMNTSVYELEASVSMADLQQVKVGNSVQLTSSDLGRSWTGRVARISDQIDPNTQTVLAFIRVNGQGLREGMYLKGAIKTKSVADAFEISRDLLVNQNALYVLQDSVLRLQKVALIHSGEKNIVVSGLAEGTVLLKEKVAGAFEGMKVKAKTSSELQSLTID